MTEWTTELIADLIETYKSNNDLECFDKYGTLCNFKRTYEDGSRYKQDKFFFLYDGSGFAYEYDFTTNSELNDLTLMLKFTYKDNYIEVSFYDLHVM